MSKKSKSVTGRMYDGEFRRPPPPPKLQDYSVVYGLGNNTEALNNDVSILLDEPQASSTACNKKTRAEVHRESLEKRNNEIITHMKDLNLEDYEEYMNEISPPKSFKERLASIKRNRDVPPEAKKSESLESSPSLIDVNGMSELSGDSFLFDKNTKPMECEEAMPFPKPVGLIRKVFTNNVTLSESLHLSPHTIAPQQVDSEDSAINALDDPKLQVSFNQSEITGRSTEFGDEHKMVSDFLDKSKNYFSSYGKEGGPIFHELDNLLPSPRYNFDEDEAKDIQNEQTFLSEMFGGDHFDNSLDWDKIEADILERNKFNDDDFEARTERKQKDLDLTGKFEISNLTVRPSWIEESSMMQLVDSNNRIRVDDMFRMKSEKLGSLTDKNCERPSFGDNLKCRDSLPGLQKTFDNSVFEGSTFRDPKKEFNGTKEKVMKPAYNISAIDDTIDASKLEMSLEVMQLKKHREALMESIVEMDTIVDEALDTEDNVEEFSLLEVEKPPLKVTKSLPTFLGSNEVLESTKLEKMNATTNSNAIFKVPFKHTKLPRMGTKSHLKPVNHTDRLDNSRIVEFSKFNLPSEVNFPQTCLLGMSSEQVIPFQNPSSFTVKIFFNLFNETLNNNPIEDSFISFKESVLVSPHESGEIKILIIGKREGVLKAKIDVQISKLASSAKSFKVVSSQQIRVEAVVERPAVDIVCEGETIDYGVIPESCKVNKTFTIINNSQKYVPILLKIIQDSFGLEEYLFTWASENDNLHMLSPTLAAFELEPALSKPSLMSFTIAFTAPSLDNYDDNVDLLSLTGNRLQIELDTPDKKVFVLSRKQIEVQIGKVVIRTIRQNNEHWKIFSDLNVLNSMSLPLVNHSKIPINLTLTCNCEEFDINPMEVIAMPNKQIHAVITFTPNKADSTVINKLSITIEPNGNSFELEIYGICNPAPKESFNRHLKVQQSLSNPHLNETSKFSLQSSKTNFYFGCVAIGNSDVQKFALKNDWRYTKMKLKLFAKNCEDLTVVNCNGEDGKVVETIEIDPSDQVTLYLKFCPSSVKAYSTAVIVQLCDVPREVKFPIPVHGYGGSGLLSIPSLSKTDTISLPCLGLNKTTVVRVSITNIGSRPIFVKLRVFLDNECRELLTSKDICLVIDEFLIDVNKSREITLMASGTAKLLSLIPQIGVLQVIYGNELLRRRFCKLTDRMVKTRRVRDPAVLTIDWDEMCFDTEISLQDDNLPPQGNDALTFFNSCSVLNIPLLTTLEEENEFSITTFSPLVPSDETINETISRGENWKLTKTKMTFKDGDCTDTFVIINFCDLPLNIKIDTDVKWISYRPNVFIVPAKGDSTVVINLDSKYIANFDSLQGKIKVISSVETREILVSASKSCKSSKKNPEQAEKAATKDNPIIQINNFVAEDERKFDSFFENKANQDISIESNVKFSPTDVNSHTCYKIKLENQGNNQYEIKATLVGDHFFIKFDSLLLKPKYFLKLPVYYKPSMSGSHQGLLIFSIGGKPHKQVSLYGRTTSE